MIQGDDKLLSICRKLGILVDLYRRYVDDMVNIMGAIFPGCFYNHKKGILEYNSERAETDS